MLFPLNPIVVQLNHILATVWITPRSIFNKRPFTLNSETTAELGCCQIVFWSQVDSQRSETTWRCRSGSHDESRSNSLNVKKSFFSSSLLITFSVGYKCPTSPGGGNISLWCTNVDLTRQVHVHVETTEHLSYMWQDEISLLQTHEYRFILFQIHYAHI